MVMIEKGKRLTLLDTQTMTRKMRGFLRAIYPNCDVRFYGGYIAQQDGADVTRFLFEASELGSVWYMEFDPSFAEFPIGVHGFDMEAVKLDLDFMENLITWQSEHPELFESE